MAQQPRTRTGKLSDQARHVVLPSGIVSTGWPAVRDKCAELAIRFDVWQDGAGRAILAKRADGSYACSIGGAVMSIPRQVGKTFLIGAIVFALCLLKPGTTVIWTAHRLRTAEETFAKMQAFARKRKIAPFVKKVVLGSGDEEIEFTNGSRILFGARERGFGRGFDQVDVLVFDEAQILTENAIDDMVPATNQSENPLLFFIGTPPKPSDPSEVFTAKRAECLSGEDEDTVYIEFSAERGCDPMDRKEWARANPSFPSRTNESAMLRMKKNLTDESFIREALGIWDEVQAGLFDMSKWAGLVVPKEDRRPSPVALSVAVSQDRQWTHIGLAGMRTDGKRHLQVVRSAKGTDWAPDALAELVKNWSPVGVAVEPNSPAGSLIPALQAKGIEPVFVTGRERGQAVGMFIDGFAEGTLTHQGETVLAMSVELAKVRDSGESKVWDHRVEGVDVAPLQAVTNALFALCSVKPKKRSGVVV